MTAPAAIRAPAVNAASAILADGTLRIGNAGDAWNLASDRPELRAVERFEPLGDGYEQSWTFSHLPTGDDALVVRVHTSGARFDRRDGRGLHFVGETSSAGFVYGAATWIDAEGRRTSVAVDHDGADIVLTVPRAVLRRSTYPAKLDPFVGSENVLDQAMAGIAPPELETMPSVVSVNGRFFLAWFDTRTGGISGARVDPSTGYPVAADSTGVSFVTGTPVSRVFSSAGGPPGLATDGVNTVLLTWTEAHSNKSTYAYAERIDATSGAVFPADVGGVQLGPTGSTMNAVAAWDGHEFIVGWDSVSNADGTTPLRAVRVDPVTGVNPADGQGATFTTAPMPLRHALVVAAAAGTSSLFAWLVDNGSTTYIDTAVVPAGTAIKPVVSAPVSQSYDDFVVEPTLYGVASDGAKYVIESGIYGVITTTNGTVATSAFDVSLVGLDGVFHGYYPFTGVAEYMLGGLSFNGVYFVAEARGALLFFTEGNTLAFQPEPSTFPQLANPAFAAANGTTLMVGTTASTNAFSATGAAVSVRGVMLDSTALVAKAGGGLESIGVSVERAPAILSTGKGANASATVFFWDDRDSGNAALFAVGVDPTSGARLEPESSLSPLVVDATSSAVPAYATATDGTRDVIAWIPTNANACATTDIDVVMLEMLICAYYDLPINYPKYQ